MEKIKEMKVNRNKIRSQFPLLFLQISFFLSYMLIVTKKENEIIENIFNQHIHKLSIIGSDYVLISNQQKRKLHANLMYSRIFHFERKKKHEGNK